MGMKFALAASAACMMLPAAWAQSEPPTPPSTDATPATPEQTVGEAVKAAKDAATRAEKAAEATNEALKRANDQQAGFWLNFGIGAGVSITANNESTRLKSALIDSQGIVRIDRVSRASTGFYLEAHAISKQGCLFRWFDPWLQNKDHRSGDKYDEILLPGCEGGLFVAALPGSEQVIEGLGAGYMFRLHGGDEPNKPGVKMNIGAGVMLLPNSLELREGLSPDQPVPTNFDRSIPLTQNVARTQFLFIVSFSS